MFQRKRLSVLVLTLLVGLPFASWGAGKTPLAHVEVQPTRVDWLPRAAQKSLELRIAGPGDLYIQKDFAAGESPSFNALDRQLPDGVYTYELRAAEGVVQTGSLWVQDGRFVEPEAQEPKPPLRNVTAQTTVLADDLVVQGQACIGASCLSTDVNGAALRIKETNNYQIKFDALNCCVPWEQPWILQANEAGVNGDFLIRTPGTIPVRIMPNAPDNSFVIYPNGNIGLGTLTPAAQLHVRGTDTGFRNRIFVENASATTTPREMLEIRNNGGSVFILKDTSVAQRWAVGTNGSSLVNDNQANAGLELTLGPTGNLTISGTLTQNSDRTTKHDIVPVKADEILGKVLSLPIATWVRNGDEAKHLGPMAQDFSAAFGLGEDERHIATLDMAGVSLASVQALNSRMTTALTEKDTEIETLRRENSDLAQRLAVLEQLVSGLRQRTEEVSEQATPTPNP
jgi:hypothetical protein